MNTKGIQQLLRYFQISLIIMQIVFYVHLIDVTVLYWKKLRQ